MNNLSKKIFKILIWLSLTTIISGIVSFFIAIQTIRLLFYPDPFKPGIFGNKIYANIVLRNIPEILNKDDIVSFNKKKIQGKIEFSKQLRIEEDRKDLERLSREKQAKQEIQRQSIIYQLNLMDNNDKRYYMLKDLENQLSNPQQNR